MSREVLHLNQELNQLSLLFSLFYYLVCININSFENAELIHQMPCYTFSGSFWYTKEWAKMFYSVLHVNPGLSLQTGDFIPFKKSPIAERQADCLLGLHLSCLLPCPALFHQPLALWQVTAEASQPQAL